MKINETDPTVAFQDFLRCCGSTNWAKQMVKSLPFENKTKLLDVANDIWFSLAKPDWLEAFSAHPKIGDNNSLKKKYQNTVNWSQEEQSGIQTAPESTLEELKKYNDQYENKFGYIFIVCATGKTASEMLTMIKERIENDDESELRNAAREQSTITRIRLEKLL